MIMPDIETHHFHISELTEKYYYPLFQVMTDGEFVHFFPELSKVYRTIEDIKNFIRVFSELKSAGSGILLGITRVDELLGFIAIMDLPEKPIIFYATHPSHRNSGIMTEAVRIVITQLFRYTMCRRMQTEIYKNNIASLKVIRKAGFKMIREDDNKNYWEIEKTENAGA